MSYKIEKQPNGLYKVRVWSKQDALGKVKTKQKSDISGMTAARKWAQETEYELEENVSDITFLKLDDLYYNERKDKVSPTTLDTVFKYNRQLARNYLGNIKANRINTAIIQDFIDNEQKSGLKQKTVKNHVAYILSVLNWGVNFDKLEYNRVKKLNYKDDEEEFEATTLELEQVAEVLYFMKDKFYNLYIPTLIAFLTGARRGEILGLTWDMIDFENNIIHFKKNMVRSEGEQISKRKLKTKTSKRSVAMADFLKEELLEHKTKLAIPEIDDHVCSNVFEGQISPDYLTHTFHDFMKNKFDIEMREHDLRHTFSQLVYDNEELLLTKSKMMGHSSTDITKNVYTRHKVNARMFNIVNTLGETLRERMIDLKNAEN